MRNLHHFSTEFSALFLVVFFLGCASRPDEALKLAQQAMEQAKQEQASEFASGDWKSAEKAWNDAQTALKNQRYGEAAALLTTSKSRFEKAGTIAKAKREEVRKEVMAMQNAANRRLSVLRDEINSIRVTARAKRDLDEAFRDVESIVDKLNTEMLNEQFIQAKSSGQIALRKLTEVEKKVASVSKTPIY
jgi:small-conductance mechanosensitive channel